MISAPMLLVCDSPGFLLEDMLPLFRGLGYECCYVPDPDELSGTDMMTDVVIVSASIKGGPHGTAFANLRRKFSRRPLMVIAHVRSLSTAIEFFRAGADDYLPAPLTPEEARRRIQSAISKFADNDGHDSGDDRGGVGCGSASRDAENAVVCKRESVLHDNQEPVVMAGGMLDKTTLDLLSCGVLVCDHENRLRHSNPAALSLLGQPTESALSIAVADPIGVLKAVDCQARPLPLKSWPPLQAAVVKASRGGTFGLMRPDNSRVWVRMEALPMIRDGRVDAVIVTIFNITEDYLQWKRGKRGK